MPMFTVTVSQKIIESVEISVEAADADTAWEKVDAMRWSDIDWGSAEQKMSNDGFEIDKVERETIAPHL